MRSYQFVLTLAASWLMVCCRVDRPILNTDQSSAATNVIPTITPYTEQLTKAVTKWQSHNLQNYHFVITYFNLPKGYNVQREIIVQAGHIVSNQCLAHIDCSTATFSASLFRIEDFYQIAESVSDLGQKSETALTCVQDIRFNETYGYITLLAFHCEGMADDESRVEVTTFEILK